MTKPRLGRDPLDRFADLMISTPVPKTNQVEPPQQEETEPSAPPDSVSPSAATADPSDTSMLASQQDSKPAYQHAVMPVSQHNSKTVSQQAGKPVKQQASKQVRQHAVKPANQHIGMLAKDSPDQPAATTKPVLRKATYYIRAELIKPLKLLSVELDRDQSDLVSDAIADLLAKWGG